MLCCFGGRDVSPNLKRAETHVMEEVVRPVLPGCELITFLGRGTYGIVLLVRERSTREFFAVKIMNKHQLAREDVLGSVQLERQVLRDAGPHPFVVECHSGIQTRDAVVLVLEYLSGGDMFDLLKTNGSMNEEQAAFYLAEIAVAIGELHRFHFVLRDLKLENILLDREGHIRLTDFGLAAKVKDRMDSSILDISGTAIYQAPEILNRKGHGRAVDWWAFGILAFVIMVGKPPFSSPDLPELYRLIREAPLSLDSHGFSEQAKDLILQLLNRSPEQRLGTTYGVEEIMHHPFFRGIDWDALLRMEIQPPFPAPKQPPPPENVENPLSDDTLQAFREFEIQLKRPKAKADRSSVVIQEYVVIPQKPDLTSTRPSIGLDFDDRRRDGNQRTWTGTTDDFGRTVSSPGNVTQGPT
uniref:Protein kinase domain-containing protein n=1 Tax=Compsopogon caeruleus TaxID=31354 RepID=A0A7S1XFZ3_9RHOD|mmetsp:Transcript_4451/g.8830  ORF Transcript_4451/g.8830 Transcript_4451/m.8830 type:complete len:412 (+) Transcript_4451:150-1385(+)